MPRGDGTGPLGAGSLTGRGLGFCTGSRTPGYANRLFGRAIGFGGQRNFRRIFCITGLVSSCAYLIYRLSSRNKR